MSKNILKGAALATLSLASVLVNAQVLLSPGAANVMPSNNTLSIGTFLDSMTSSFTGLDVHNNEVFAGTLLTQVGTDYVTGNLDFVYEFSNTDNLDPISVLSVSGFAGYTTYVGQGPYALPNAVAADATSRSLSGKTIFWDFQDNPVNPGQTSDYLLVFTNAKSYVSQSASLQDGGVANAAIFAPAAVPEPASMTVLGLGIAAIARRKRK